MTTIVWFRRDLRLADNAALSAAADIGDVVPVFIWSPEEEAPWQPGGASRVWLHASLRALKEDLRRRGLDLVIRRGPSAAALDALIAETGAGAVHWNRLYEPATIPRDRAIKEALKARGMAARSFAGALLHEPSAVATKEGRPFQVFSPFWRAVTALEEPPDPLPVPSGLRAPEAMPAGLAVEELGLLPRIPWDAGIRAAWTPGEAGAAARLAAFLDDPVGRYHTDRDFPGVDGCSRLSPHLHFGEITPRAIWHAAKKRERGTGAEFRKSSEHFVREVGWREFAHHLLFHFPHTASQPLRPEFAAFPWRDDAEALRRWQRGQTGYPIVDAGMRELWETGWMHNRVRMIVASFLVKDLLVGWREGAAWFWDTLVDADLASNTLGWQWTAGCGADAAPYFRIFNPVLQAEKFDPMGHYVRRWVPEVARLPDQYLHQPWNASPLIRREAGLDGGAYPDPMVDHSAARDAALAALAKIKK